MGRRFGIEDPVWVRGVILLARQLLPALVIIGLAGCGGTGSGSSSLPANLAAGMRPIGAGVRFHPPVRGHPTGVCRPAPGGLEAHVELFGANRVVLIPSGVGHQGRCFGSVVTLDPTGTVHFRSGATLRDLFRAWGQPLGPGRMAAFHGHVRYYLAGRRVMATPSLHEHAEIVLEVGPYVPPHSIYTFPRGL